MQHRTTIQGQTTAGINQSNLTKFSVGSDPASRSDSSSKYNLYSSNKNSGQSSSAVGNSSIIARKYFDPEFQPIRESITKGNEGTSYGGLESGAFVVRWLRPEQIQWSKETQQYPLSVFSQPHSKDITQGRLGNCWFISALSLISEIPQLLDKVMITKRYNPFGLYKIRLCNRGIWQVVIIDDMLPVSEYNSFVFTRAKRKQLFASLVEKALAKMYGSYQALENGRCVEGLQILTGEPCDVITLNSTDPKNKPNLDQIWTEIIQSRAKGYLMTCVSADRHPEQIFYQTGLELGHAYSIVDARQVGSKRAVRLCNPLGIKDRNASVSNNSTQWPRNLKEKSTSSENDGVFWMLWEKMSSFFNEITICKISAHAYKVRKRGQFTNFSSKITSTYSIDCPYGGELEIELFNADDGKYYNRLKDPDVDLFLIILDSNGSCQAYKHILDYYLTLSTTVLPGRYIILAGSMSVVNCSIYSSYNLVVHGDQQFILSEQPSSPELVGNAFHAVALRANTRKDLEHGLSILTFNDNGAFGFICENKSNRPIRFTSDFQGSLNVFSSRKVFHMVDIIPAKTKQLLAIFTRRVLADVVLIEYQIKSEPLNKLQIDRIGAKNNPPLPSEALGLHISKPVH